MVACDLCGKNFSSNSTLDYHFLLCYREAYDSISNCESVVIDHAPELDHWLAKKPEPKIPLQDFACDLCGNNFRNNSTLEYHTQMWYCEACESTSECESDFIDHVSHIDHWRVKKLEPNWTAKISQRLDTEACGCAE